MTTKKPSVLACVTDQYECDRIISTARQIADDCNCELHVLSVLKPMKDYSSVSDRIEYLHLVSMENNADMNVLFQSNAPKAAAEFAVENNVQRIVTGMHDGKNDSFLVQFNQLVPKMPITMVAENNIVYSMDLCECYS